MGGRAISIVFGVGVLACLAWAVVIGLDSPDTDFDAAAAATGSTEDLQRLIDLAMSDYEANDSNTESAPQQQVVNGWVARDLLQIIALQQEASADTLDDLVALQVASPPDDRPSRLLVVLTVLLGWIGIFAVAPRFGTRSTPSPTEPAAPPSRPGASATMEAETDFAPPESGSSIDPSPTDSGAGQIDGEDATSSSVQNSRSTDIS